MPSRFGSRRPDNGYPAELRALQSPEALAGLAMMGGTSKEKREMLQCILNYRLAGLQANADLETKKQEAEKEIRRLEMDTERVHPEV